MEKENLIRSEANGLANRKLPERLSNHNAHRIFVEWAKSELLNYYSLESKIIFLDEIMKVVNEKQNKHKAHCTAGPDCPVDLSFEKVKFFIQQEIDELPQIISKKPDLTHERKKVFISYSHNDKDWLNKLKRHFKPLEERVDFWEDSKIKPGQKWKEEIGRALNSAKIAILLLSADYFNSDFILENELPPLLELADKDGCTILSIIVKPCMFDEYPKINRYQAMNKPSKSLIQMDEASQEILFVELVKQVKEIISK